MLIFSMLGMLTVIVIGIIMLFTFNLTTGAFVFLFILFWVFGIMFFIEDNTTNNKKTKEVTNKINRQLGNSTGTNGNDYQPVNSMYSYTTPSKNHAIKIRRSSKKISILTNRFPHSRDFNQFGQYDYVERRMDFKEILETRIVENGATITKTSRASQIGGAALGGLLAGNVGAMIGGLSGKKTSVDEVNSLELIIIVNSFNEPIIKIPFFDVRSSVKKSDRKYKTALNDIQRWNAILGTLIQTADNDDIKKQQQEKQKQEIKEQQQEKQKKDSASSNNSLSDEINKLVELKNNNHITEEEFKAYKKKLLN